MLGGPDFERKAAVFFDIISRNNCIGRDGSFGDGYIALCLPREVADHLLAKDESSDLEDGQNRVDQQVLLPGQANKLVLEDSVEVRTLRLQLNHESFLTLLQGAALHGCLSTPSSVNLAHVFHC